MALTSTLKQASPALPLWLKLLNATSDLLALLDKQSRIVWVNKKFENTSGHTAAKIVGRQVTALLGPSGQWAQIDFKLKKTRSFTPVELNWFTASGELRWGRVCAQALPEIESFNGGSLLLTLQDITELRHHQAESRRLAELLDMVQEFGRLGIWERNIPSSKGKWDRHMFRFFGMESENEVPDFEVSSQRIHPEDRPGLMYQQSICAAGKYASRYRLMLPNGETRHVHSQWEVKNSAAGIPVRAHGIIVDDTEAYQIADSYNTANSQLKMAVQLSNIAIWRLDLASNRYYLNQQGFQQLGLSPQPQGLSVDEMRALIHPEDLPLVVALRKQSMKADRPLDQEVRYRRSDGSWIYVLMRSVMRNDAQGNPIELTGIALDVTERVRTGLALRNAKERVMLAVRSVGMGTWEWDPETKECIWDNAMFQLRGLNPQHASPNAQECLQFTHPEHSHNAQMSWANPTDRTLQDALERRVEWPDGSVHWLASRSTPVTDEDGRIRHIGVNWDITETRNAAIAQQERALAQRECAAKAEFLSRMSHELRTPLNAVLGFSQLLKHEIKDFQPAQRDKLDGIQIAGSHLLSLINNVLDLSSLENGQLHLELQPVVLSEVVQHTLSMVQAMASARNVTLHAKTINEVVFGDPTRIRQVLINLLSNAIKYNQIGGHVTISSERRSSSVMLKVHDTGIGMSKLQLAHLFEPFNRLGRERSSIQGAGIGLTMVKALVERMGGTINVSSQSNVGSHFEVSLPLYIDAIASPPQRAHVAGEAALSRRAKEHLLYIEDNLVNIVLVEELVRTHAGLTIESVNTGLAGIARAKELRPDLILIDIQLPDMDGFEVLRRLREQDETADIPCIALSANAMPEDFARAKKEGFNDYWTKPIDFGKFLSALERLFQAG